MSKDKTHASTETSAAGMHRQATEIEAAVPNTLPNGEMMTAFIRAGHSCSEGFMLLGQEVLDFSRQRISRDSATALSMARSKDWDEASKIHREWFRATSEECSAQMGRMLQLAAKTAIDSCRPLQEHAHRMWGEPNGRS